MKDMIYLIPLPCAPASNDKPIIEPLVCSIMAVPHHHPHSSQSWVVHLVTGTIHVPVKFSKLVYLAR